MDKETEKKDRRIDSRAWYITLGVVAVVLVICIVRVITGKEEIGDREETLNTMTCFQDFETTDLDGNVVDETILSDYKMTVINCWGTFCGPCIAEMPDLYELSQEYEAKGVQIIGLCTDITDRKANVDQSVLEDAKSIVSSTGAAYTHLIPSPEIVQSCTSNLVAVPTTIFVDAEGNVISYTMGSVDIDSWRQIIDEQLAAVE